MKGIILSIVCCASPLMAEAQSVFSPNRLMSVTADESVGLHLLYNGSGDKTELCDILCGEVHPIGETTAHKVGYWMQTGKRRWCANEYTEQLYRLASGDTLAMRVYNDGFAWKKPGSSKIEVPLPRHYWLSEWTDSYENFFPSAETPTGISVL